MKENILYYLKKSTGFISKIGPLIYIIVFLMIIYYFYAAIDDISKDIALQQLDVLESGLMRMTIQHYALEGEYPASLNVLIENYGFSYNSDTFVVHYENLGDNLLPQTSVFLKNNM